MYKKINKKKLFRENDPFRYYKHIMMKDGTEGRENFNKLFRNLEKNK